MNYQERWSTLLTGDAAAHHLLPSLSFEDLVACEGVCRHWRQAIYERRAYDAILQRNGEDELIPAVTAPLLPSQRIHHSLYGLALRTLEGHRKQAPPELAAAVGQLSVPAGSMPGKLDAKMLLTIFKAKRAAEEALSRGYSAARNLPRLSRPAHSPSTDGRADQRSFQSPLENAHQQHASGSSVRFMTPHALWLRGWLDFTQHTVLLLSPPAGLTIFFILLGMRMDNMIQCSYTSIFAVLILACALVVAVGVQAIITRVLTERARAALYRAGLLTSRRPGATVLPVYGASMDSLRSPMDAATLQRQLMWLPQGDVERRFTVWGMAMWWLVAAVQRHRQYTVWALAAGTVTVFFVSPFVLAWQAQGDASVSWRFAMAPALFVLLAALVWPNVIGSTWGRTSALMRVVYNVVCCPLAVPLLLTLTLSALRLDGADISLETVFMPVWLAAGLITATVLCGGATALITSVQPNPSHHRSGSSGNQSADESAQGLLAEDSSGGGGGLRERRGGNRTAATATATAARSALQIRYNEAWQSVIIFTSVASVLLCGLLLSALLLLYRKVAEDEAIAAGHSTARSKGLWWSTWSFAIFPTWALALCVLLAAAVIRKRVLAFQAEWIKTQEQRWAERAAFTIGAL